MKGARISSFALLFLSVALTVFCGGSLFVACKGPAAPSPATVEAGIAAAPGLCTYIENVTGTQDNPGVETLCANAGEIATIIATVAPLIALADTKHQETRCKVIPTTTVCATPEQLHAGIAAVARDRRARFLVDGGLL